MVKKKIIIITGVIHYKILTVVTGNGRIMDILFFQYYWYKFSINKHFILISLSICYTIVFPKENLILNFLFLSIQKELLD